MNEIAALFLSFAMVFAIIGVASFLLTFKYVSPEVSRKIIHIGVSNWWLIAMNFMENPVIASVGPVSFIIINIISYRQHLFPAMEEDAPRDNLGTIYFPISLLILVLLCFNGLLPMNAGAAGILALGYGDGFAALAGKHFGRVNLSFGPFRTKKTLLGSSTMFAAAAVVLSLIVVLAEPGLQLSSVWGRVLLIALGVTLIELFTPKGFDNISVPLLTALLFRLGLG